jgi:hypothetical protein
MVQTGLTVSCNSTLPKSFPPTRASKSLGAYDWTFVGAATKSPRWGVAAGGDVALLEFLCEQAIRQQSVVETAKRRVAVVFIVE